MADPWADLAAGLAALDLSVDPRFAARARLFVEELGRWSAVGPLSGYRTPAARVEHLVLESLLLLRVLPDPVSPLLDIGTGVGVPGLILKLARPAWAVTLVEANRRRVNFVRHVVRALGLEAVEIHLARAEALTEVPGMRRAYRTVTLRAVAALPAGLHLASPFVHPEGHVAVALGPGPPPSLGTVHEVSLPRPAGRLPIRRSFLIIRAAEVAEDVPRGTRGVSGARPGRRQPEGRRR